ncbi:MAG: GumC family protein [Hyphomicrobium sp.]|jgi:uncharacterized protein involved in exopolysaccharide biosynthesis
MVDVIREHFGHRPSSYADGGRTGQSTFATDLKFALGVLGAHRLSILLTIVLFVVGGVGYIWITPPLYSADAQILIDPRKRDIVKQEIVQSGLGSSSLGADTFLLDSQVEVIRSQTVLRKLIETQKLDLDEEFTGSLEGGTGRWIGGILKLIVRGPQASGVPETTAVDRVLKALEKRLRVNREGNTYVINIRMTSLDPAKAAKLANTLAQLYIDQSVAASRLRVEEAMHLLSGRLEQLRDTALEAEQKVETYRAQNGLLATDKSAIFEQELRDFGQQLTLAGANTSRAEARWDDVRRLKDQPLKSLAAKGSLQSSLLTTLQDRYAAVVAQEASLASSLLRRHPNLTAVHDAKAALEREIKMELTRLISRAKSEFEVARANEDALRTRVAVAKAEAALKNQAAVTLRELEQEAQSAGAIYQEFLNRSKDAREQVLLPSDTVRVVSQAFAPSRPSWPVEPLLLGFAIFLGLIFGVVFAFVLHVLKDPLRQPRDGAEALAA